MFGMWETKAREEEEEEDGWFGIKIEDKLIARRQTITAAPKEESESVNAIAAPKGESESVGTIATLEGERECQRCKKRS